MRSWLPCLLVLGACVENPYVGGGNYPVDRCTSAEVAEVANTAGETMWDDSLAEDQVGRTRDFSLLDHLAYRVRLSHFCGHTVLLVSGDMRDPKDPTEPGPIDWLDDLPSWVDGRDPSAPRLTVITAWWANADGEPPTVGDLRRFRDTVEDVRGDDVWFADGDPIITVQDPWRFQGAAAAASAMQVVSDVPPDPDPSRRYRREHEVRDRWPHNRHPFFVVLHPTMRIAAMGDDPASDGIIEAIQADPGLRR